MLLVYHIWMNKSACFFQILKQKGIYYSLWKIFIKGEESEKNNNDYFVHGGVHKSTRHVDRVC
jgi:hypothetical protein